MNRFYMMHFNLKRYSYLFESLFIVDSLLLFSTWLDILWYFKAYAKAFRLGIGRDQLEFLAADR